MNLLLGIALLVLMLPVLLVVAIALGPAALGLLFIAACAAVVWSLEQICERYWRRPRVPRPHG